jgi:hypothetical protein
MHETVSCYSFVSQKGPNNQFIQNKIKTEKEKVIASCSLQV